MVAAQEIEIESSPCPVGTLRYVGPDFLHANK